MRRIGDWKDRNGRDSSVREQESQWLDSRLETHMTLVPNFILITSVLIAVWPNNNSLVYFATVNVQKAKTCSTDVLPPLHSLLDCNNQIISFHRFHYSQAKLLLINSREFRPGTCRPCCAFRDNLDFETMECQCYEGEDLSRCKISPWTIGFTAAKGSKARVFA